MNKIKITSKNEWITVIYIELGNLSYFERGFVQSILIIPHIELQNESSLVTCIIVYNK